MSAGQSLRPSAARWWMGGTALALFGLVGWLGWRRRQAQGGGDVVGRLDLGSGRAVVAIDVDGETVVLGVSERRAEVLTHWASGSGHPVRPVEQPEASD